MKGSPHSIDVLLTLWKGLRQAGEGCLVKRRLSLADGFTMLMGTDKGWMLKGGEGEMVRRYILVAFIGSLFFAPAYGWREVITVPYASLPPLIDGRPDDPIWRRAPKLLLSALLGGGSPEAKTIVQVCFDRDAFFVLFLCAEREPEKMRRFIRRRDGEVWTDDCVEVFLAPDPEEPSSYYHIVVNSLGVVRDEFWQRGIPDVSWDSQVRVGVQVRQDYWVVELALPFRSLDRLPIFTSRWRANFGRERWTSYPPEWSTWRPCRGSFHDPSGFGSLLLNRLTERSSVRAEAKGLVRRHLRRMLTALRELQASLPQKALFPSAQVLRRKLKALSRQLLTARSLSDQWRRLRKVEAALPRLRALAKRIALAEELSRPYALFVLSPMVKQRPDQLPEKVEGFPKRITLHAAKGEGESIQLFLASLTRPLRDVRVSVTPLLGPKGSLLFPEVRRVGYVPVRKPTPGGFGIKGLYPDPLLPLTPFDVPEGEGRAVWITVWVPRDVPEGEYVGAVTVRPRDAPKTTLRLTLHVYPVSLPPQSFLKTCLLIWEGHARRVYGKAWTPERSRRFYEMCLRYRFTSPPPLPWGKVFVRRDKTWTARWEEFDRAVREWMRKGATAFRIVGILRWGTKLPPPKDRFEVTTKLRLLDAHLQEKGWSDRFYFYVFDEPHEREWEAIKALCAFVRRHAPNLSILLTAGYGATGPFRAHAPTGKGAAYRGLAGFIRIWVPHIDCFDAAFLRGRKAAGDQVWMYVCISTAGKTYPDIWRIDWTGVAHRAIGWWLWHYGCNGFLYWSVNYWTRKGKTLNLFRDPVAYPGGNGDGFLFYPDPKRGDPIPSVRVEIMRDGFEDYDLLCLLQDAVRKVQGDPRKRRQMLGWLMRARRLLRTDDLILAPNRFLDDPSPYEERHRQILEMLKRGASLLSAWEPERGR